MAYVSPAITISRYFSKAFVQIPQSFGYYGQISDRSDPVRPCSLEKTGQKQKIFLKTSFTDVVLVTNKVEPKCTVRIKVYAFVTFLV